MIKNADLKNLAIGRIPGLIDIVYKNSSALKDFILGAEKYVREFPVPITSPVWGFIILALEEGEKYINRIAKGGPKGISERFKEAAGPYRSMKNNVMDFVRKYQNEAKEDHLKQTVTETRSFSAFDLNNRSLNTRIVLYCREQTLLDSTMTPEALLGVCREIVAGVSRTLKDARQSKVPLKKPQLAEIKKVAAAISSDLKVLSET